jgi:hypothetical protein
MATKKIYRIRYLSEDKVYEIYAKHVYQGSLYGFVVIEDILFGESGSSVVVDPAEERLKREFEGVSQTQVPMHAVLRIDLVEKQGTARIQPAEGKIANFPSPVYTPKTGGKD